MSAGNVAVLATASYLCAHDHVSDDKNTLSSIGNAHGLTSSGGFLAISFQIHFNPLEILRHESL